MPVKVSIKRGTTEITVEAQDAAECRELLKAAAEILPPSEEGSDPGVGEPVTQNESDRSGREGRRRPSKRSAPGAPSADVRTRLQPLFDADPEEIAAWTEKVHKVPTKYKMHGVLAFGKAFGLDGFSLAELRAVMNDVLNLNLAEGTWTSYLATAPPTEILKVTGGDKKKVYRLVKEGQVAWDSVVRDSSKPE